MRQFHKLLIVREDKLGDTCFSLPVLTALRKLSPETQVVWVCQEQYRDLVQYQPNVSEVWVSGRRPSFFQQLKIARRIRKAKFDATLILRPGATRWQSAAWLGGIRIRVGSQKRARRGHLTSNLYHEDWVLKHEARKALDSLEAALGSKVDDFPGEFYFPNGSRELELRQMGGCRLPEKYYVLQLGTGGSNEEMSPSFFAAVANRLQEEFGLEPALTGIPSEQAKTDLFRAEYRKGLIDLVGKTDLVELASLVQGASFVLTVDTGIGHVAACVGTPSVVIFPKLQTVPERWIPWQSTCIVVRGARFCSVCEVGSCHPGEGTCTSTVSLEEVLDACRELLN